MKKFLVLLLGLLLLSVGILTILNAMIISQSIERYILSLVFFKLAIDCFEAIEETTEQYYE